MRAFLRLFLPLLLPVGLAVGVLAQPTPVTRHELSFGVDLSTDTPNGGTPLAQFEPSMRYGYLNPQLRYTFNLNRNIAFETSVSDSVNGLLVYANQGGHQALALAGVKAGIRRGHFGFFATSAAGVMHFSRADVVGPVAPGQTGYQGINHFALRQGFAFEYAPTPRNFLRFDVAELLDAQFQRTYPAAPGITQFTYSGVPYHASVTASYGHRFGRLDTLPSAPDSSPSHGYSVGGLFVMGIQQHLLESETRAQGGGGAWIGFPLAPGRLGRYLLADAVAYDQPHDDHTANVQDGGTTFSAFLGPRIGFRKGPVGLYAKARPGIVRFSRTDVYELATRREQISVLHPKIDFALDTGLVLEYAPPTRFLRHAVVRFEGGSVYTHYHGATLTFEEAPLVPTSAGHYYFPPQRHSSLVFLSGFGYRF